MSSLLTRGQLQPELHRTGTPHPSASPPALAAQPAFLAGAFLLTRPPPRFPLTHLADPGPHSHAPSPGAGLVQTGLGLLSPGPAAFTKERATPNDCPWSYVGLSRPRHASCSCHMDSHRAARAGLPVREERRGTTDCPPEPKPRRPGAGQGGAAPDTACLPARPCCPPPRAPAPRVLPHPRAAGNRIRASVHAAVGFSLSPRVPREPSARRLLPGPSGHVAAHRRT